LENTNFASPLLGISQRIWCLSRVCDAMLASPPPFALRGVLNATMRQVLVDKRHIIMTST
jgi:hypothetical protein